MALKDWKLKKESEKLGHVDILYKHKDGIQEIWIFQNNKGMKTRVYYNNPYNKSGSIFEGTKGRAIAFAKSYMRSH